MQLEWAHQVHIKTGKDILILAPLAVAQQPKREGDKFGIPVTVCRSQADMQPGINVANYEMLIHFETCELAGVVLDESSIMKHHNSKTRGMLIERFVHTPYKLCCTATPAPNDHMELGGHSEFLGIMSRTEMLSTFFVHDGGDTSAWRLKGHAEKEFWAWVCSWAVMLRTPSDLGYSNEGFDLPPLTYHQIEVTVEHQEQAPDSTQLYLFPVEALTLIDRRNARKVSLVDRVAAAVKLVQDDLYLTGNCGKMAICGNQNTPKTEETSITQTQKSVKNVSPKTAARQSRKKSTCESTTKQTKSDGTNIESPTSQSEIKPDEIDTQTILSIENNARHRPISATKPKSANQDYAINSASVPPNTTPFSQSKMDVVPFAEPNTATVGDGDCMLTTAIQPVQFEDCSAQNAISDLGILETILPSLQQQSNISQNPSKPNSWIIWVNLNSEQEALEKAFGDKAFSVQGSTLREDKEAFTMAWIDGDRPVMISKPSVLGFGLNFQHCHNAAYVGLSDSFEEIDQSVHRIHRYGQQSECHIYIITSELEGAVVRNVERKRKDHERMTDNMIAQMKDLNTANIHGLSRESDAYGANKEMILPEWFRHAA